MMTCSEYQSLDELLQAQLLWVDGNYLVTRYTEKLKVVLFSLYGYYVEVFFDKDENEPLYFKSFDNLALLDKYLERICIDDVSEKIGG